MDVASSRYSSTEDAWEPYSNASNTQRTDSAKSVEMDGSGLSLEIAQLRPMFFSAKMDIGSILPTIGVSRLMFHVTGSSQTMDLASTAPPTTLFRAQFVFPTETAPTGSSLAREFVCQSLWHVWPSFPMEPAHNVQLATPSTTESAHPQSWQWEPSTTVCSHAEPASTASWTTASVVNSDISWDIISMEPASQLFSDWSPPNML